MALTPTHAHTHTHMHTHAHTHAHIRTQTPTRTRTCTHVHHPHAHVHPHAHARAGIHLCIHTYVHTYLHGRHSVRQAGHVGEHRQDTSRLSAAASATGARRRCWEWTVLCPRLAVACGSSLLHTHQRRRCWKRFGAQGFGHFGCMMQRGFRMAAFH